MAEPSMQERTGGKILLEGIRKEVYSYLKANPLISRVDYMSLFVKKYPQVNRATLSTWLYGKRRHRMSITSICERLDTIEGTLQTLYGFLHSWPLFSEADIVMLKMRLHGDKLDDIGKKLNYSKEWMRRKLDRILYCIEEFHKKGE